MYSSPVESTAQDKLYNLFFEWPSTEPYEVIVTGTFDDWSKSKLLNKTARGFVGNVQVPWDSKVKYKFFVDGKWLLLRGQPTEMDPGGYINNIIFTPPKPASTAASPEEVHVGTEEIAVVSPPEAVLMPVAETPVVTVVPLKEEAEAPPAAEESDKPASRLPILPLNSTEHNTIANGQAPPAPPDYVLAPSPRASRTLPAADVVPETHPAPEAHEDVVISPPEAENKPVDETPVVTVLAEAKKEEASPEPEAQKASRITTLPLLPVNSTEHNTIKDSQAAPVPDFVLPPPRRTSAAADESAKPVADASVTPSNAPVTKDLSAVHADKDSMGELDALKQEQLNGNGEAATASAEPQAPVVPVPELAPKPEAEAKAKSIEEGTKNEAKTPEAAHKQDASSSSSSSSSSSDSSKTTKEIGAAALPSPPVTPPGKHKRYFSFHRPGSPSPSHSTEGTPARPPLSSSPSSRSGTSKKKRHSFIAKIKEIFHHDHDDKDPKKSKSESQEKITEKV
ncbi:hypothetical protein BKA70DRAFT_1557495 [Coprinopsis sp. MPI-PUGE-AT-0042]|nr:hypothetical protein BKA70DRAFT_1557495 [Coprinopsis sp. MPI-PUGE-AT-0042]